MRRDGTKAETGTGPWLALLTGAAAAVVAVIALLSYAPARSLQASQIDLTAPVFSAPAAPSAMR